MQASTVPRERGASRTDHDQLGNVPLSWTDTIHRGASPVDSGVGGNEWKTRGFVA